jgi:hypothetical protein
MSSLSATCFLPLFALPLWPFKNQRSGPQSPKRSKRGIKANNGLPLDPRSIDPLDDSVVVKIVAGATFTALAADAFAALAAATAC